MSNRRLRARIVLAYGCQANFAQALRISESRISRVVRGRKVLSDSQKVDWASRLGCEVEEIFPKQQAMGELNRASAT